MKNASKGTIGMLTLKSSILHFGSTHYDPLILDPHHTCIHWQLLTILTGRPSILLAHLGISRSGTAVEADYHWWRKVANIAWLPACLGDGNQPAIDISANEALDHFLWNLACVDIQYSSDIEMVCMKKRTRWNSIIENLKTSNSVVCGFIASQEYWSRWWFQNMKHLLSIPKHRLSLYALSTTPLRRQPSWTAGVGEKKAPPSVVHLKDDPQNAVERWKSYHECLQVEWRKVASNCSESNGKYAQRDI